MSWLRRLLPVVVVVIVAACGPAPSLSPAPTGSPPSPSTAVASPVPSASSDAVILLSAGPDPLPPGTYSKAGFVPPITFAIEAGWVAGTVTDGFFDVQREAGTPDVIAVQFAHVDGVGGPGRSIMPASTAVAAVDAIHANPALVVVDESASRMSGFEGLNVIVENQGTAPAPVMRVSAATLSIDPGRKLWISLFDTSDGLLAVMVGGSVAEWERALTVAEPVLESVVIDTAPPA